MKLNFKDILTEQDSPRPNNFLFLFTYTLSQDCEQNTKDKSHTPTYNCNPVRAFYFKSHLYPLHLSVCIMAA